MLLVDVYLDFLTGKALVPMEGHHEELISDPTGTLSLVLETFSNISQLNKGGDEVEVWHGVMFTVLFKLFGSRDRLSRLSQGEALTLLIKSLQSELKHPLKNRFVSPLICQNSRTMRLATSHMFSTILVRSTAGVIQLTTLTGRRK